MQWTAEPSVPRRRARWQVPALEQPTPSVNREYAAGVEEGLRERLSAAGEVRTIPYKCNRAAVFVSDQYHESLPFRFEPGYAQRRANLTLLFGDRWRPLGAAATGAAAAASGDGGVVQGGTAGGNANGGGDPFDVFG